MPRSHPFAMTGNQWAARECPILRHPCLAGQCAMYRTVRVPAHHALLPPGAASIEFEPVTRVDGPDDDYREREGVCLLVQFTQNLNIIQGGR